MNQCLPPIVSVETGGSLTTNGTIYLGIQAFNESGVNFCSTLVLANYTVGSRIRVQFNSANRTEGTLFPYYLLIASPNNDKANGHVIGIWKNWEDNGKTLATFSDLLLSQNTDLTITPSSVANPLALPTNAIQGQIRTVTSLGAYYMRLNTPQAVDGVKVISDSLGNKWVLNLGSTNYGAFPIGGTSGVFGCHQPAANIDAEILANNPFFPRPIYTPDGSGSLFDPDQSPIRLAFLNLYESEMGVGRRLRLNCFLNGSEPVSNLLSGKIFARVLGFVNIESGELVTENDTGDGNDMDGIGEWVSVDTKLGFFVFQRPLPYNWVVAVEIAVGFKSSELQIAPGSVLSFTLSCGVQSGVLVEGGLIYRQPQGGLIYKDENYTGRVLPDSVGVKVGRMRGGMIHGSQSRIFEFLDTPEQFLSGFLTNTVGQKITLSRDGVATFRGIDAIQSSEALLAIVSTKAGESRVFWGASESVLSSQGISALITYPSGGFNVSLIRFYLLINGVLYRQDSPSGITTGLTSQTFNISAITGFSLIALEPTNYIPGLFLSPGIAVSLSSGSLSGNIKLGVSYVYSGSVLSAISQDVSLGCLPILDFDAMIERTARKMALIFG
ncbi:MAG: hypothetical protein RLZZ532_3629 [Cyanobacteriota bacterium]